MTSDIRPVDIIWSPPGLVFGVFKDNKQIFTFILDISLLGEAAKRSPDSFRECVLAEAQPFLKNL